MKHDGFFCRTYDTFTGYANSCNLPSCRISFAVATWVALVELQIPISPFPGEVMVLVLPSQKKKKLMREKVREELTDERERVGWRCIYREKLGCEFFLSFFFPRRLYQVATLDLSFTYLIFIIIFLFCFSISGQGSPGCKLMMTGCMCI